jgi:fructose-specific component phosphotransferase system IIB-like protein
VVFVLETTLYDGVYDSTTGDYGQSGGANGADACSGPCAESDGVPFFINNVARITQAITEKNTVPGVASSSQVTFALVDYFSNNDPSCGSSCDDHDDGDGSMYNVDVSAFSAAATFSTSVTTMSTTGTLFGDMWESSTMIYSDSDYSDNFLDSSMIVALYGALHGTGLGWVSNASTYHVIVWIGSTLPEDPAYQGDWCVTHNDQAKACKDPTLAAEPAYTYGTGLTSPTDETLANITTLARSENVMIDTIDLPDGMTELNAKDYVNPTGTEAQLDVNNILSAGCFLAQQTGGDWEGPSPASSGVGFTCSAAPPGSGGAGNLTDTFRGFTTPDDAWSANPSLAWALTNIDFPSLASTTNATAQLPPGAFIFIPAAGFDIGPGKVIYQCSSNGTDISSACAAAWSAPVLNGMAWDFPLNNMYPGDVWSVSFNVSVAPSFPPSLLNQSVPLDLCENTSLWSGCTGGSGSTATSIHYVNYLGTPVVQSFPPVFVEVVNSTSEPVISSVAVSPTSASLNVNDNQSFVATQTCTGGPCPASVSYSWSLMNGTQLGSLNSSVGNPIRFTAGTVGGQLWLTVNATLNFVTVQSSPVLITIIAPTPTLAAVALNPSYAAIQTGGDQSFTATVSCHNGNCPDGTAYLWTLNNSLGSLNATSGPAVTFTAGIAAGETSLVVNATLNGISVLSSPAIIDIGPISIPSLMSVNVDPSSATLAANGSVTLTATPTCSATCPSGAVYSWSMNKAGMGSFDSSAGNPVRFTAGTTAGTLVIFANGSLNGKQVESPPVDITITATPQSVLESVAVTPQYGYVLTEATLPFSAAATCSSDPCPSGLSYAWTLSSALGTVSPSMGSSTTFTAGPATGEVTLTLTATLNGASKSATASITVVPVAALVLSSVSISPSSLTLTAGYSYAFTATPACTSEGNVANCPSTVSYSWTLNDYLMGQMSQVNDSLTFTAGNSAGTVTLTVTCTLDGRSAMSNATITIVVGTAKSGPASSSFGVSDYLIALAVAVVIAAVAVLFLFRRRKESRKPVLEQQSHRAEETTSSDPPA